MGRAAARLLPMTAAACLAVSLHATALAGCRFVKFAAMPMRITAHLPELEASINDQPIRMVLDSGAFATMLTRRVTDRLDLTLAHAPVATLGVNGRSQAYRTRVRDIRFGPVHWTSAWLLVMWDSRLPVDAFVGADFLFENDVEMAWKDKQLRFFRPDGCEDAFLAYWDANASMVPMKRLSPTDPRQSIPVEINGVAMRALLDTGAAMSSIDVHAAARAGMAPPDAQTKRRAVNGGGTHDVDSWRADVAKVVVGQETIGNTSLAVMDMWKATRHDNNDMPTAELISDEPEVVLGMDFFRSHRVLFAVSQRRFYFSHLGGAVFASDEP
jgi:predicted aspartyl protease